MANSKGNPRRPDMRLAAGVLLACALVACKKESAPAGQAESYGKGSAADGRGTFTAEKAGIHGWYWKNTTRGRVTVVLRTAGFYTKSITSYDGDRTEREIPGPIRP